MIKFKNLSKEKIFEKLETFNKLKKRIPNTSRLKEQLIYFNILTNTCDICKMEPIWNNKKIVFHLDHIDGNCENSSITNLRILCPNCHSQTDTYTGKNPKYKAQYNFCSDCDRKLNKWLYICNDCLSIRRKKEGIEMLELLKQGLTITDISQKYNFDPKKVRERIVFSTGKTISDIRKENNIPFLRKCEKINKPSKEELISLLKVKNKNQIAKQYGVSFTSVKKWIKKFGI